MDLTLHRRSTHRRPMPAAVPAVAALVGSSALSVGLLVVLSGIVSRLG